MKYRLFAALLTLFLLLPLAGCKSGPDVSPACISCAAGEESVTLSMNETDALPLPANFSLALGLFAARDAGNDALFERIVYKDDNTAYLLTLVEAVGGYDVFLTKMTDEATRLGMKNTKIRSITGGASTEKALCSALGVPTPTENAVLENISTAADLFLLCRALASNDRLRALYGAYAVELPEEPAPLLRDAELLIPSSDRRYEKAVLNLAGWFVNPAINRPDKRCFLSIAAVSDNGRTGFSAVVCYTESNDARPYAAVDAGNLAARAIGLNAGLDYLPPGGSSHAGMTVGASRYIAVIFIVLGVAAALLVLLVVIGVIVRMKRNIEGRKKYAPPALRTPPPSPSAPAPPEGSPDPPAQEEQQ